MSNQQQPAGGGSGRESNKRNRTKGTKLEFVSYMAKSHSKNEGQLRPTRPILFGVKLIINLSETCFVTMSTWFHGNLK